MSEQTARAEALSERLALKYWAFRALAAIAPRAPIGLARRVAVACGALAWALAPALRRRAARNLAHIPALAADPARLRRAARGVFITLALNYLDFFRGRYVTYEELAHGWEINNWDQFVRAMSGGRGTIVLGAHLGPFEYSAWKLGELGFPLLTPAERLRPERLHALVSQLRNHHEARLLPGDERETLRELLTALRTGQIAMFAVDRWVMGPSDAWPLFGAPARLPTAPFALAARSDAPVVLLTSWREGLDRFTGAVEVITPERMPADGGPSSSEQSGEQARASAPRGRDREAASTQMRQRVYAALERYVSAHPEQWVSALSPVWEFPGATPETAPASAAGAAGAAGAADETSEASKTSETARVGARTEPARSLAGENR